MAEPLKYRLNKQFTDNLANKLSTHIPSLDKKKFISSVHNQTWNSLELKQRLTHLCKTLHCFLPKNYDHAVKIILNVAPEFTGFEAMFFPEYVSTYGLAKQDRKTSLMALATLTQYSSSEFAIRPFIMGDPEKTMQWMHKLSFHKNYHMRRLASEGCRPRLPWASALPQFKENPQLILPILETLRNDPELYVRRSVANNINDICKDNPTLIFEMLRAWKKQSLTPETDWIIRHGLRSLIKQGNKEALSLVGIKHNASIETKKFSISKNKLALGETLQISFDLINSSQKPQLVMVDYIIHHIKKNGSLTPKVFKLQKLKLEAGELRKIEKVHKIRKINTRQYYSGNHFVQLQVNGSAQKKIGFYLKV